MQRRRPAQRECARAADDLIDGERVRVRPHLAARFCERHMTHARPDLRVLGKRGHDVRHRLVAFIVGVKDPRGVWRCDQSGEQFAEVAIVNKRPVVLAAANDAHEAIGYVLHQIADDTARAAIDHPGTHDNRAHAGRLALEYALLVRGTPRDDFERIDRSGFVSGCRRRSQHPDAGCIDQESVILRRQLRQGVDGGLVHEFRARTVLDCGMH